MPDRFETWLDFSDIDKKIGEEGVTRLSLDTGMNPVFKFFPPSEHERGVSALGLRLMPALYDIYEEPDRMSSAELDQLTNIKQGLPRIYEATYGESTAEFLPKDQPAMKLTPEYAKQTVYEAGRIALNLFGVDTAPKLTDIHLNENYGEYFNGPSDFKIMLKPEEVFGNTDLLDQLPYKAFTAGDGRSIEAGNAFYITGDVVDRLNLGEQFFEDVHTARDARDYIQQHAAEVALYRAEQNGELGPWRTFGYDLLTEMRKPGTLAEEIIALGVLNWGGKAIRIAKAGPGVMKRWAFQPAAVLNDTGRAVVGNPALRAMARGEATAMGAFRRGLSAITDPAMAPMMRRAARLQKAGFLSTTLPAGALFFATDQSRYNRNAKYFQLKDTPLMAAEWTAVSAGASLLGGQMLKWQINGLRNAKSLAAADRHVRKKVGEELRRVATERGVTTDQIPFSELQGIANRAINDMSVRGWDGMDSGMKDTLARRMSHFMFRGPESLAYITDNNNFKRGIAGMSDNMSLPDHMRYGSDISSDANAFAQANNGALISILKMLRKSGIKIDATKKANEHSMRNVVGRIAFETIADDAPEGREVLRRLADRMEWTYTAEQESIILNAVDLFKSRLRELNRLYSDTGAFNIGYSGFNEAHMARVWDRNYILDRKDDFVELLANHFVRSQFEEVPDGVTFVRSTSGQGYDPNVSRNLSQIGAGQAEVVEAVYNAAIRDAEEVVANFTSLDTSMMSSYGAMGTAQHRLRTLSIPNDYSITTAEGNVVSLGDFIQVDPSKVLMEYNQKTGPQVYSALKYSDPAVMSILRNAAEAEKAGDLAAAHNMHQAARMAEVMSNIGMGAQVERLRHDVDELARVASDIRQAERRNLNFERLVDTEGNTVYPRRTEEAYEDAVVQAYDMANPGANLMDKVDALRRRKRVKLQDISLEEYPKPFEADDLPLPASRNTLIRSLRSQVPGYDDIAIRLLYSHPGIPFGRSNPFRKQDYEAVRNIRSSRQLGPLWANDRTLQRSRATSFGNASNSPLGAQVWSKETVLMLSQASDLLFFHFKDAEVNRFKNLFKSFDEPELTLLQSGQLGDPWSPDQLGVSLKASSLGNSVTPTARTYHELFTEAVVRYVAGDKSLSDFSDIVPDMQAFKSFVAKYARGFYRKNAQKKFFQGKRRPRSDQSRAATIQRTQSEISAIDSEIQGHFGQADMWLDNTAPEEGFKQVVRDLLRGLPVEGPTAGPAPIRQRGRVGFEGEYSVPDGPGGETAPFAAGSAQIRQGVRESLTRGLLDQQSEYGAVRRRLDEPRREVNKWIQEARTNVLLRNHVVDRLDGNNLIEEFVDPFDFGAIQSISRDEVKRNIINMGPRQFERARDQRWNIYRIIKEGQDKNANVKDIEELVDAFNRTVRRVLGVPPANAEGLGTRKFVQYVTKVLYANASIPLAMTQIHDLMAPIFVSGLAGWGKYMVKAGKEFLPFRASYKERQALAKAQRNPTGMTDQDFSMLAENSASFSNLYPEFHGTFDDLTEETGKYRAATAPSTQTARTDTLYNNLFRKGLNSVEQMSDKVIQHTMHEVIKRTRIAANMYAVDTLPDEILKASRGDETSLALLRSLGIGEEEVLKRLKKQMDEHGDDFTKFDAPERLAMRSAIQRYTNNLVIMPSTTATPEIFDTPLGRLLLQFKRFLVNAPQRHIPNAMKRGGAPAVIGGLLATTMWGMMVEGWMKPMIRGEESRMPDRDINNWNADDYAFVARLVNSGGQFGYLPEMLFAGYRYDMSRIPALYNFGRMYKKFFGGLHSVAGSLVEGDNFSEAMEEGGGDMISGGVGAIGLGAFFDAVRWYGNHQELGKQQRLKEMSEPNVNQARLYRRMLEPIGE